MWRPNDWWNPFDFMDIKGAGIWVDIFINPETGEKMSDDERQRYKKIIEFGADMMLSSLSGLRMKDIAKVIDKVRINKIGAKE